MSVTNIFYYLTKALINNQCGTRICTTGSPTGCGSGGGANGNPDMDDWLYGNDVDGEGKEGFGR